MDSILKSLPVRVFSVAILVALLLTGWISLTMNYVPVYVSVAGALYVCLHVLLIFVTQRQALIVLAATSSAVFWLLVARWMTFVLDNTSILGILGLIFGGGFLATFTTQIACFIGESRSRTLLQRRLKEELKEELTSGRSLRLK